MGFSALLETEHRENTHLLPRSSQNKKGRAANPAMGAKPAKAGGGQSGGHVSAGGERWKLKATVKGKLSMRDMHTHTHAHTHTHTHTHTHLNCRANLPVLPTEDRASKER